VANGLTAEALTKCSNTKQTTKNILTYNTAVRDVSLNNMPTAQPDLFDQPQHAADADLRWLEEFLRGGKCWFTAGDILLSLGRPASENNKRWLRALANASAWIISGQSGYRHIENCSPEEIHHCAATLESQAKEMASRAGRLRQTAHKIFG
jgi:hypothetical protein